mgnify:CR=1 FL=1
MKQMIMSIADHLGGVRSDQAQVSQSASTQAQVSQNTSQNQTQSTLQTAAAQAACDDTMSNDEDDESRKKLKQSHPKVFNTEVPGFTNQRANSPQLLQTALDNSNGSDGNLSTSEEDLASMYD